jgi:hypothetical protein
VAFFEGGFQFGKDVGAVFVLEFRGVGLRMAGEPFFGIELEPVLNFGGDGVGEVKGDEIECAVLLPMW